MNTQEIITTNPSPTVGLLVDALVELGGAVAARSLPKGTIVSGEVDRESTEAVAEEFHTTVALACLAAYAVTQDRPEREHLASLGLQEHNETLMALGREHVARLAPARILAAAPPDRFSLRFESERGIVAVTFPVEW